MAKGCGHKLCQELWQGAAQGCRAAERVAGRDQHVKTERKAHGRHSKNEKKNCFSHRLIGRVNKGDRQEGPGALQLAGCEIVRAEMR